MEKELVIHATPTEVQIALLEDKRLVEIHHQTASATQFTVGDIFVGKIKKLLPGLNAAFVDIGHKKDAFLHYTDLGPKVRSLLKYVNGAVTGGQPTHQLDNFKLEADIQKNGKVEQIFIKKQLVLVQVLKEPISTKGPRLSCEISLPGRLMVLTPFGSGVSVSKKIANEEERQRLLRLAESIKPKNFGMIIRTAAEGKRVADLHEEVMDLVRKWQQIHKQLHKANPPLKLLSEVEKTTSIIRDILNDSFSRIVVDGEDLFESIKDYLKQIAPHKLEIVKFYNASKPIFDHYGVTHQIKASFGKTATMPSGAYLVIEHTEAMHVIDVNSGQKLSSTDQEMNALNVNTEAIEEIARQLRLRDIGGLIIIDFIDMRNNDHKIDIYKKMKDAMEKDKAKHTILPLSKFGLMQITRERVRPEVTINTAEVCPSCNGTGSINASILLLDDVERDLDFIIRSQPLKKLTLHVHPYVQAFLKKGFLKSPQLKWLWKYKKWIYIVADSDCPVMNYSFRDEHEEEIKLN